MIPRPARLFRASERGRDGFERKYPLPGAAPIVGYWSLRYGSAGLEGLYVAYDALEDVLANWD